MICVSTTNYYSGSGFAPPTVKSVRDSAGLAWTDRGGVTPEPIGSIGWRVEEWTAIAPARLSNDQITVSLSGISYTDLDAFGISGANTASPFDTPHPSATGGIRSNWS